MRKGSFGSLFRCVRSREGVSLPLMMTMYDDVVMRTIVEIPAGQLEGLDRHCKREGISRAEAVRQAVALLVGKAPADLPPAFGLWARRKGRPVDGVSYQRALRGEWDARDVRRRS